MIEVKRVRFDCAKKKPWDEGRRREKGLHWRKESDCVKFAKYVWQDAERKSVDSVSSNGCTKGVGRIGELGTEGAMVEGRVVVGVAEREAEFERALVEEEEALGVLPMPPRESTGSSAMSIDEACLGTTPTPIHRRFNPPCKCPHPCPRS
jgi:hypothetical protein